MSLLQAIILGVIQGLTEFLPISSTAHLRIAAALFDWPDPGAAFTAVIQWGTLIAVLVYFAGDVARIARAVVVDLRAGQPLHSLDARLGWMIVLGTVPIVLCGLLFQKSIETTLRSLYVIAASSIVMGLLLLAAEVAMRRRQQAEQPLKGLREVGWRDAIGVGLAQALALIPGSSRSGVTITGGLFLGMTRETAARFSFLLSLPAVCAAGVLQLLKHRHELLASQDSAAALVLCTLVSGVVGYLSIAFLVEFLKRHSTFVFIAYRLVLGVLLLVLLATGAVAAQ